MKRITFLLTAAAVYLLSACSDGSTLPTATGKATINAINAVYGSPTISVLIEERGIGSIAYQGISAGASYDDLAYTFNFDVLLLGETELTRIASQFIDVVANQNYTLMLSGTLAAPVVTMWEVPIREFGATETVFQARFAHTSAVLQSIDIFFALDGVVPVAGEEVATLVLGEISAPMDFEADEYVVTITPAGQPGTILYQSAPAPVVAGTDMIFTPFDGDANNTAPIVVWGLAANGGRAVFADPLFPSTIQFLNASLEMGNTDVYDDDLLTSQILTNHDFRQMTAESDIADGDYQFFYTPPGETDPGAIVLTTTPLSVASGRHLRIIAHGVDSLYATSNLILNNRSLSSAVKLNYFSTSTNFDFTSIYLIPADEILDEQTAYRPGIASRSAGNTIQIEPGSYDLYLKEFLADPDPVIAGPYRLDVALGDVVDMVVFDNVDPAIVDIVVFPTP